MKFCRFSVDGRVSYGIIEGETVREIDGCPFPGPYTGDIKKGKARKIGDVKLLAPVVPSKIVAIGLNYRAHAAEFKKALPEEPMLFMKPSTSVIGPGDEIIYPTHMSHRVDYEGELAVVIGSTAKDVPAADARKHIFGYTCFNDVTARDLQGKDVQYTRAKGFDTFACVGPCIETGLDPLNARIETYLNGEKKQDTSTADMIFDVFELVSFVSHVMTMLPGDVIATGTPSGVGKMRPGDSVEVRIEGIGSLVNKVAEAKVFKSIWTSKR
ncbi:MAG TPA: fumarylacetoacetate hydrolase family protein [Thermodesulfobacteriota bacterium]|nr:fumarylacetoacetate hydrolase family protein [Thermodesulfobacteriota bacterium]